MPTSVRDALLPLDGLFRLSQNDRMDFYNLVDAGIGPAQGIEECAGTYKAHMERLYFRSYPGAQPRDEPCCSTTPAIVPTHPSSMIEKENVNPRLSTSHAVMNSQPYYGLTAVPPSPLRRISHFAPLSPRREQLPTSSASATTHPVKPFLLPSVSTQEKVANSISTPPPTDSRPHDVPLIWMSPVNYSPSAPSQLRTQQWQAQMSQVLARSSPFAMPTFYTPSGDHIVYQAKSTLSSSGQVI
ncbi:hypothetical protein K438DRAFT_554633 [Mycena galopus ATCC 62051]|nr:hypothetical protein K438DRAFT_554633 [Mycena galopus ATCC 62051]